MLVCAHLFFADPITTAPAATCKGRGGVESYAFCTAGLWIANEGLWQPPVIRGPPNSEGVLSSSVNVWMYGKDVQNKGMGTAAECDGVS